MKVHSNSAEPGQKLIEKVVGGEMAAVKELLDGGADVNARGPKRDGKRTALMYAARLGLAEMVELLIQRGASVDETDVPVAPGEGGGWTALHYAVGGRQHEVAVVLIGKGADPYAKTRSGITAFQMALRSGTIEPVIVMFEFCGCNVREELRRTPELLYHLIIEQGVHPIERLTTAKYLLEHGADVNAAYLGKYASLMAACVANELPLVDLLIDAGVEPDRRGGEGDTPLMFAAQSAWFDVARLPLVKRLIDAGASLGLENDEGKTVWDMIEERRESDVTRRPNELIEVLKQAGADRYRGSGGKNKKSGPKPWPPLLPDFSKQAEKPEVQRFRERLEQDLGTAPVAFTRWFEPNAGEIVKGAWRFDLGGRDPKLVTESAASIKARGWSRLVIYVERTGEPEALVLFSTRDWREVLRAVLPCGANSGVDTNDIVAMLEPVHGARPFLIERIGMDHVGLSFEPKPRLRQVAERLHECKALLTRPEPPSTLATVEEICWALARDGRIELSWD